MDVLNGQATALDGAAVQALRESLRGSLLGPGDEGYDAARRIWNGMIDRRPALIARCTGAADVIAAVTFAREHRLLVSVRGGGHNVAGSAVCDGGLVIDLSLMRGVRVDPRARTVRVQGGATWADVDRETQVFGLATPNGYVSTTGVAGLTLGGGYGHLRRKYGLSCDNLVSVDIVTADGRLRTASDSEHPDLFWGVRGGGGNFGVVTSFEFRLHPVGPEVFLCAPVYPLAQARAILARWRDFMATAPEDLSSNVVLWSLPDIDAFPPGARGEDVVIVAALYPGDPEEGARLTQPLRELATPLLDLSGAVPYAAAQASFDPFFPYGGLRYYWKATHLDGLGDEAIEAIVAAAERRPSPQTLIPVWHFGGAMSRVAPDATAFWHRQVPFMVSFDGCWTDPADDAAGIAWSRDSWANLRRFSADGGVYVNFLADLNEDGDALARAAYGGNYRRLAALKQQYDPGNLFRANVNIRPPA